MRTIVRKACQSHATRPSHSLSKATDAHLPARGSAWRKRGLNTLSRSRTVAAQRGAPHLRDGGIDIGTALFLPSPFTSPFVVSSLHHVFRREHVSVASCGVVPILAVHRCASFAPCPSARAAHSFAALRTVKALLAHVLARCAAMCQMPSRSSTPHWCVCSGHRRLPPVHMSDAVHLAVASLKPTRTSLGNVPLTWWNQCPETSSPSCSRFKTHDPRVW